MTPREHGGGVDAAVARWGGVRAGWLDLSTGINPVPYPVGQIAPDNWTALPDSGAMARLLTAARRFWDVPEGAGMIAAPGASALIARIPGLCPPGPVHIPGPTYNEHAAAFAAAGHVVVDDPAALVRVMVHPNNPDGRVWHAEQVGHGAISVVDESFCDVMPERSLVGCAEEPGVVILKSFGKFWGLAGLRLGFAIGPAPLMDTLAEALGPWPVSGPALQIGAAALSDVAWAQTTRARLAADTARLDHLMVAKGAQVVGGTTLFRLYAVDDAALWQDRLAKGHVWSRRFAYAPGWLRLGLPAPDRWAQLEAAL